MIQIVKFLYQDHFWSEKLRISVRETVEACDAMMYVQGRRLFTTPVFIASRDRSDAQLVGTMPALRLVADTNNRCEPWISSRSVASALGRASCLCLAP